MKTLLTVVLFTLCATPTFAQQALANKPPKVFGPVKTIRYEYRSFNLNRDKTRIEEVLPNERTLVWSFTREGKIISAEGFEKDGRTSGIRSVYNYDRTGRLASIVHYPLDQSSFTETFAYPDARHVKITRIFAFDKHSSVEIDEYDEKGNITKATFHDTEGVETEFYKYDDKGNPTKFETYDGAGKLIFKETYAYKFDSHGNWITERDRSWAAEPHSGIAPKTTIRRKIAYY
jgi:hypothetical protein